MIHTLTFNPAIDVSLRVPELRLGEAQRLEEPSEFAGGKGVNVSRALKNLGVPSKTWVFLGGKRGERWLELNQGSGLDLIVTPIPGETRQNLKIFESSHSRQTDLNLPGPTFDKKAGGTFLNQFAESIEMGDSIVLAGSGLSKTPKVFWKELAGTLKRKKARLLIDTTGEPLEALVPRKPWVIKLNLSEYSELCGKQFPALDSVVADHRENDCFPGSNLILTDGPRGALGIAKGGSAIEAFGIEVEVRGTVGAGDAYTAGWLVGWIESGGSWPEAMAWGTATSAGAVELAGTQFAGRERVEELLRGND